MTRLLLIYSLIVLASRVLKGVRVSREAAPRRREPNLHPSEGDMVDTHREEERRVAVGTPPFSALTPGKPPRTVVTTKQGKLPGETARALGKKEEANRVRCEEGAGKGLFSGSFSYVQGVIMSEVLQAPRAKRPWQPHI